jgi:predicted Co/Zn/Cd cation transporter (cation efflux family)
VFFFLVAAGLLSALVAGFGMARGHRNWLSVFAYAAIVALTMYVMIDMEYPRGGLIRIGAADLAMTTLRDSIR